ncbi:MAG TPA: GIY-YIG nuclease family protein [Candidatus Paceibacterota bacterium]|nr:GIY-YIG nuclease family protein [Verrucomicrobiota bacterium]HSA08899.1 GIY-YIG nuclease family protein [Candidatus Paceibacterota bacterium]
MTAADLPEDKGTYVLIAFVPRMKRLEIGRLGAFDLVPGFYAYVGSAFGPGGLRARVGHHLESVAEPHWHIDYLLRHAEPLEVWYALAGRKLEQDLAALLARSPGFHMPIPRFGSSDYHRGRTTHLFHSKRPPSFARLRLAVSQTFGHPIQIHRLPLGPR